MFCQKLFKSFLSTKGLVNYKNFNKTHTKLFPNFTWHHLIIHTDKINKRKLSLLPWQHLAQTFSIHNAQVIKTHDCKCTLSPMILKGNYVHSILPKIQEIILLAFCQKLFKSSFLPKGLGNYKNFNKTSMKLFPNFTCHHLIIHTDKINERKLSLLPWQHLVQTFSIHNAPVIKTHDCKCTLSPMILKGNYVHSILPKI